MSEPMDIPAAEQIARLLAQVESLSRDNERLAADNAKLARAAAEAARVPAELERELRDELAAVRAERDRLVEMVLLANQRFFGCRSEKVVPDQLSLFNDMEAAAAIVRAPMPAMPIKGSFATPSLIAYVLNGKYVNALPLYRMEYDFKCLGAPISRQNMANWTMRAWELWLSRLRARMKALLLEGDIVHADESEVQVLKEPGREAKCKSRMWLFASPACSKPIFIYEYNPTRSGKVAEGFLRGWSGWLCTDGYRPYFTLENGGEVVNVACMVHIRRKFAEIVKSVGGDAKAEAACSVALAARRRIDAMFAIDSNFDEMAAAGDFEGRRLGRERDLRPMMEDFFTWAQARRMEASPRMALDNALKYAVDHWPYAMNALGDGRLELDNNLAERAIKPFVIGRKNFLFSDTPRGAEASAGIYSVVATAKANGLNPRKYLEWLLEEMPNAADLGDPAYLDSLMPWSDSVPEEIRLKPEAAAEAAKMADDPIIDIDPSAFSEDGE